MDWYVICSVAKAVHPILLHRHLDAEFFGVERRRRRRGRQKTLVKAFEGRSWMFIVGPKKERTLCSLDNFKGCPLKKYREPRYFFSHFKNQNQYSNIELSAFQTAGNSVYSPAWRKVERKSSKNNILSAAALISAELLAGWSTATFLDFTQK